MSERGGPLEGVDWAPGRSGNRVSWDGTAVVKRYQEAGSGWRELAVLTQLTELPVPRLLPGSGPAAIRMPFLSGAPGAEAIDAGDASRLLNAMGRFLRELHDVDVRRIRGLLPGSGDVVVHGDFATYNVILNAGADDSIEVLDWEAAFLGSPLTDLAWCESQFRAAYPRHGYAVEQLFAGYGKTPRASDLQGALASRLAALNEGDAAPERVVAPAQGLLHAFRLVADEAAAFVGALSRAASGPEAFGAPPAQVWLARSTNTEVELLLNDAALAVVARAFAKRLQTGEAVHLSKLGSETRLLFVAGQTPAMGRSEAERLVHVGAF